MPVENHIPYETIARYLADAIDADERASVDRHLEDCKFCRKDLEDASQWRGHAPEVKRSKAAKIALAGLFAAMIILLLLAAIAWLPGLTSSKSP